MTVSMSEFQKNIAKYEKIAASQSVTVENKKTGVSFTFKMKTNPMQKRLDEMRVGKGLSHPVARKIINEN